ncbi:hypothetical protein Lal_00029635 [Lupinus albus]|nr:hypothetical protein Lal_00029635 [Lupinus albus]
MYAAATVPVKLLIVILVYSWPKKLLNDLDGGIRNFIWSGDTKTKKLVTVVWHQVCSPISEGDLGLRSITTISNAALLKLSWEMFSSTKDWAIFFRKRFTRESMASVGYFKSFVWPGIKGDLLAMVKELLLVGIINAIATIWFCRNKSRFGGTTISRFQAFNIIKLATSVTEYDSSWVVDIFNDKTKPRRNLSNFWDHCSTRNLHITHIFREGNGCADKLANFGVYNRADFWWDETPSFLLNEFIRNTFQLHSYRFRFV